LTSYKVVYDARETANPEPAWQLCAGEMFGTVPGMALSFMETVVLTAISVAISTRLSILPNLVICGAIYALGHLGRCLVGKSDSEDRVRLNSGVFDQIHNTEGDDACLS